MDVKTGKSLWQAGDVQDDAPRLEQDVHCEVAVIGGGITGTLVAHYLLHEGVDTVLLEKHNSASASTSASTGLLQYEIDTPLFRLIRLVGEEAAVRSYRLGLQALDEIERLAAELPDRCGFSRKPSYYLASQPEDLDELRTEYDCRTAFGFDARFLSAGELAERSSLQRPGAIRSSGDAQIDPLRFTRELARQSQSNGLRRFHECHVQRVMPKDDAVLLATPWATVRAKRIVIATGYAAHQLLKRPVGTLHSTYAVAGRPFNFNGWPEQALIWETARPYCYLRTTPDGRAIIGGGDTDYSTDHARDELLARKVTDLRQEFARLFPHLPLEVEFAWAGTFGETKDGLAYIGECGDFPLAYFAMGYGGNGITFGAIAARIITDLFVGRPNSDAAIFRFDR